MDIQNFGELAHNTGDLEKTDSVANDPMVNSDPLTENTPTDVAVIQEVSFSEAPTPDVPLDSPIVPEAPLNETTPHEAIASMNVGSLAPLLNREDSEHLRTRWNEIQGKFVDEPRVAVQQADALVSEVLKQVIQIFANEHSTLESQWNQGNDVSTEDLRKALQHYRSFFNRLVV